MALNFPKDDREIRTLAAMKDPQPGDRFQEMFSFWVYVVHRGIDEVVTMEANPPCTFPTDAETKHYTLKGFFDYFSYGTESLKDRFWVDLCDRGNNVAGWYKPTIRPCANDIVGWN